MVDINILCLGQEKYKKIIDDKLYVDVMNKNCNKFPKGYCNEFPVCNMLKGIWYTIYSKESMIKDESGFRNSFCGAYDVANFGHGDGKYVYVEKIYIEALLKLAYEYIERSPISKIMLLFRYQNLSKENIKFLEIEKYEKILYSGKVKYNIAYIISKR
jgi:hypothetical protein